MSKERERKSVCVLVKDWESEVCKDKEREKEKKNRKKFVGKIYV